MEEVARTMVNLAIIVDNSAPHIVCPSSREKTFWRLVRVKVLGVGLVARPVRSEHLLKFINFEEMSAHYSKGVKQ